MKDDDESGYDKFYSWPGDPHEALRAMSVLANTARGMSRKWELHQLGAAASLLEKFVTLAHSRQVALDAASAQGGRSDQSADFRSWRVEGRPEDARYIAEKMLRMFGRQCVMLGLAQLEDCAYVATAADLPLQRPNDKPFVRTSWIAHGGLGSVELDLHATPHRLSFKQAKELHAALETLVVRPETGRRFARSAEGEKVWKAAVDANSADPYSRAVIDFAETWACLMEERLQKVMGATVADIAEDASTLADRDIGISGAQYGFAVGILSQAWERGDELRRWHNLKYQLRDEGEQANEAGTVLNPAVLSIDGRGE